METILKQALTIRMYFRLTKPGIIMGNAMTAAAGFILASKGTIDFQLFLITLLGLSCIIAAACIFNNYIDRDADGKMARTQDRALAKGLVSVRSAVIFALSLGLIGVALLSLTNLLTLGIALLGLYIYVGLYTLMKYHTTYATLIGSIAGAVPPVVGFCAVSNHLDLGALILFAIIALWQMPHFFAITIYRLNDYAAASFPVLPVKKGVHTTKIHMLFYIIAFMIASSLLTYAGYTNAAFAILAFLLSSAWLWLGIKGFKCENDQVWARQMFIFSLVIVTALCIAVPICLV